MLQQQLADALPPRQTICPSAIEFLQHEKSCLVQAAEAGLEPLEYIQLLAGIGSGSEDPFSRIRPLAPVS
jgi:hypothetical protein